MDLVEYSQEVYSRIVEEFEAVASKLVIKDIRFIPISALNGDNVVNTSKIMTWYTGAPLLDELENLHISSDYNKTDARFPVQTIIRPQSTTYRDYRGYAGRLMSGILRPGDEITILPSGLQSKIKSIQLHNQELSEAFAPMSVTVTIEDDIDVSRGDMIVRRNNLPEQTQNFDAMICWLSSQPAQVGGKYSIMHTSNSTKAIVQSVVYTIDMKTLERSTEKLNLTMNAIGRIRLKTAKPLMIDAYRDNRHTGNFILIDDATNETVAAGMIV
jgi:sulfate adenylyltransferase subunit 1